jgi:hypothetical protein
MQSSGEGVMIHNNSPPISALTDRSASSTRDWETLELGTCRALVSQTSQKKKKGVLSTSWDSTLNECQPGFYRCGGTTTVKVPTGLLPVWWDYNRVPTGLLPVWRDYNRIPTGLLPVWRWTTNRRPTALLTVWRRFARTGHQPGFYRCGDKIMTAGSNRPSTGMGRNSRDNRVGSLQVPFFNLPTVPSDVNKRKVLKEDCQPGFYRCDDIAGILRSRLGQTLFLNPPVASPVRTGGRPRRGANRASTDVAAKVRGSSGPGSSRHRFSTRRRYPQCEQGDTQDKLHQPGFYRCGERRMIM